MGAIMSSLGWIDFSSEHRAKVYTVIDLLKEQGVVDELGIGVIRDSFSDRMFPGISTIQTRAKYFTLIACLIKRFEGKLGFTRFKQSLEQYLDEQQITCRIKLIERYGDQWRNRGIIGGSFGVDRHRGVARKPSSVYWTGLRAFGMIPPAITLAELSRRLTDKRYRLKMVLEETTLDRGDDLDADDRSRPRIIAPKVPEDYLDDLDIAMTEEEATFLHRQITATRPKSLLGQILLDPEALDQVLKLPSAAFDDFAELPFIRTLKHPELIRTVQHARDFWRILEGAHIRYNCLLQGRFGTKDRKDEFEEAWQEWREKVSPFPENWDTGFLWEIVSQRGSQVWRYTRDFIEDWIQETRKGAHDVSHCDNLVIKQERNNKRARARLRSANHSDSVDSWIGLDVLNYRLPQVRRIVQDIYEGQKGVKDA